MGFFSRGVVGVEDQDSWADDILDGFDVAAEDYSYCLVMNNLDNVCINLCILIVFYILV